MPLTCHASVTPHCPHNSCASPLNTEHTTTEPTPPACTCSACGCTSISAAYRGNLTVVDSNGRPRYFSVNTPVVTAATGVLPAGSRIQSNLYCLAHNSHHATISINLPVPVALGHSSFTWVHRLYHALAVPSICTACYDTAPPLSAPPPLACSFAPTLNPTLACGCSSRHL